ncbi:MAG: hypothetical protein M1823_005337 [Watsoniomyces obsoletus]|nr:MAG: hypothetical protein M1823_005337 [Watsoniomyces obsoletus]
MASFMTDLMNSIFTPGPNATLIVATNATFASLQLCLGLLFLATRSVHFIVLSMLCAGLWWAINWFVTEMEAAKTVKEKQERPSAPGGDSALDDEGQSGEDTETEGHLSSRTQTREGRNIEQLASGQAELLRRRRSSGEAGGEVSTEDEWEKVSEAGSRDR